MFININTIVFFLLLLNCLVFLFICFFLLLLNCLVFLFVCFFLLLLNCLVFLFVCFFLLLLNCLAFLFFPSAIGLSGPSNYVFWLPLWHLQTFIAYQSEVLTIYMYWLSLSYMNIATQERKQRWLINSSDK